MDGLQLLKQKVSKGQSRLKVWKLIFDRHPEVAFKIEEASNLHRHWSSHWQSLIICGVHQLPLEIEQACLEHGKHRVPNNPNRSLFNPFAFGKIPSPLEDSINV